ncbi:hypothetical protein Bca52824_061130 [Brassica carinata]|uniref:Di19 C-terminal domain-containing protein n=1 Tax=Brassica carinata TaxID=52824 RepID=A0A8X7R199_BRACI|nr:hypothetical protein Bca52824_061130 [Brassica carinata]
MAAVELFISESSLCGEETGSTAKKTLGQSLPERNVEKTLLSEEDHREKLKQSEFVQGDFTGILKNSFSQHKQRKVETFRALPRREPFQKFSKAIAKLKA